MALKKVRQSEIIKISLLISILVSLPKTLFIYKMIAKGKMDFSEVWISDFVLQLIFFFLFSWLILQINANWSYRFLKTAALRIAVMILVGFAILAGTLKLLELLYPNLAGQGIPFEERGFLFFKYVIIWIVLFFIARILKLQVIQRESVLENEYLKQQNLQNELAALKNQIDPHFLFNSLNSLNYLIRDNKEATSFVTKLSFMYRYILQSGDRNLVTVKEELKFLKSYIYLIKTRYRNRIEITISIDDTYLTRELPPLALQLLVENAVKHNEISETNPLKVKIYSQEDAICVENEIRPRTTLADGTGNGLANLDKRFYLLGKQKLEISTEKNTFYVKLPLFKTA